MQNIKDTICAVIKELKSRQPEEATKAFDLFRKNLKPKERRHTKCVSLRQGMLTVNVDSSAWLYELSQKKEDLLHKLGIKDIRFRIGEVEEK